MQSVRVHVAAYPLGVSEPSKVVGAIRKSFPACAWMRTRETNGAWLTEISMEIEVTPEFNQLQFAEKLSVTIWAAIGRYVKVAIDLGDNDADKMLQRELVIADYRKLMRIF